jgi:glycosyltransferase involved in cell wall biosynthesis
VAGALFTVPALVSHIRQLAPDAAICVMPGPLDLLMAKALRRLRTPFIVLVHDVDFHPGDGLPFQMVLQRRLCRQAATVGALSAHVGDRLKRDGIAGTLARPLISLRHPLVGFGVPPPRPWRRNGMRLLLFGRLRHYKGLDLLAEALKLLGPRPGLEVRVVGSGPESSALVSLRSLPGVVVENRWVPEDEIGGLLGWSDTVILPYREASQSGVAAAALAAGRRILATAVGGLVEQLSGERLAMMCPPDAIGLAAGLQRLLDEGPGHVDIPVKDPAVEWKDMAVAICQHLETHHGFWNVRAAAE